MDQPRSIEAAPVLRLYRHALESIFKFCAIKELHAILAVNREWSTAVVSMPSIGACRFVASVADLTLIAASRLARHVNLVDGACASSLECLRVLADRMPWIQHHWFEWRPAHGDCVEAASALSCLRRVTVLTVQLRHEDVPLTIESMDERAAAANNLIRAAACMPMLGCLSLFLLCHDERILLSPLTALPELCTFTMSAYNLRAAVPSDEQIAALRSMHSLERFSHDFTDRNGTLRLLLQAPMPPLCWVSALAASGSADLGSLLQPLSNLTELDVQCCCGDMSSLLSLPRVVKLNLRSTRVVVGSADLTPIVTTLRRCPQLTVLCLDRLDFTSAQLAELLPALPQLSNLTLLCLPELTSLQFLATDALAASLTGLTIMFCANLPSAEIVHLLGLRSLRSLILFDLREPLSEAQRAQLRAVHPFVKP